MRADGTVLGRRFIDFPSEKDQMYRTLGRIQRFQREHGSVHAGGRWAYTRRLNVELSRKIAGAVTKYAWENHADVIVFEYLSYNIGARYFIRELLKPLPATERSLLEAKVPAVKRRTSCVYADLKKLHSEMRLLKA